jgi:hypothetical protein
LGAFIWGQEEMNETDYKEFMDCLIQAGYLIMKNKTETEDFVFRITAKQQEIIVRFLRRLLDSCENDCLIVPAENSETNKL